MQQLRVLNVYCERYTGEAKRSVQRKGRERVCEGLTSVVEELAISRKVPRMLATLSTIHATPLNQFPVRQPIKQHRNTTKHDAKVSLPLLPWMHAHAPLTVNTICSCYSSQNWCEYAEEATSHDPLSRHCEVCITQGKRPGRTKGPSVLAT